MHLIVLYLLNNLVSYSYNSDCNFKITFKLCYVTLRFAFIFIEFSEKSKIYNKPKTTTNQVLTF
jgi:hypothetical protein